ncbi:cytochrome b/b6 domain-containing protein [Thalassomonas sp. M1454]|uniref:cytochrome b/b6 domain-containing protein n=1 Tax=Thalassomonas sp. M1454 TaxID=2594477 RepID=UPI00117C99CA|nr:cytochrome b/b6 domain-containing protein [Thalassomonas sp. M1454]TRX52825.1 hypothetical protein FNN08_15820 [Thalassomonas sp. M1454]
MQKVKVWDRFTQIFHISQLILLALLWYSGEEANFELHFICGFILLALWLTRITWGFIGSDTSKFANFIKSPLKVIKAWCDNTITEPHSGHNPVGGYMVLALLATIGLQIVSGLFSSDDVFSEGPLYAMVSDSLASTMDSLHHSNFDILLVLVVLHALAGVFHVFRGDNVIAAIITGNKTFANVKAKAPNIKGALLPLSLWIILSSGLYYWGMQASSY